MMNDEVIEWVDTLKVTGVDHQLDTVERSMPSRLKGVTRKVHKILRVTSKDIYSPTAVRLYNIRASTLPMIMYGLTTVRHARELFDMSACAVLDLKPHQVEMEPLLQFLGLLSFEQQLAANMEKFEVRLQNSPYPLIRNAALAVTSRGTATVLTCKTTLYLNTPSRSIPP